VLRHQWRPALVSLAALTVLTGIVYPLLVTGLSQALFGDRANGSLLYQDGRIVGSGLVGQPFDRPEYFWGRPSATQPVAYNGAASSGANLGPVSPGLAQAVEARINKLRAADPGNDRPVPVDLVTSSASGLDPHISLAAADYQAGRVARARRIPEAEVRELVRKHTGGRWLCLFGEPVVRLLQLNLDLDRLGAK
jgi:K+-transporting ATPase ATPase C chain